MTSNQSKVHSSESHTIDNNLTDFFLLVGFVVFCFIMAQLNCYIEQRRFATPRNSNENDENYVGRSFDHRKRSQ